MGGTYDAMMLRAQQSAGRYTGTAAPQVSTFQFAPCQTPRNWTSPAVSGRDLMVHRDVLRKVAHQLSQGMDWLRRPIANAFSASAPAVSAAGSWPEARLLGEAIGRAHDGITRYASDLMRAHEDTATRLMASADRYDAAEQQIKHAIHAATDPSATIIGNGGLDTPVHPGYGQHWTQAQVTAYDRMRRLMLDEGPVWNGTFPIADAETFTQSGVSGYTWQQVRRLLEATDPGAVLSAAWVFEQLASALKEAADVLPGLGQDLAENWGGTTAVTAVSQVQQLYQTAVDLQANTTSAQNALQWYGEVLQTFLASPLQPASSHPADVAAANTAAQQRMAALNNHVATAYYAMPGAVNKNLPPPLAGSTASTSGTAAAGYTAGGQGGYIAGGQYGGSAGGGSLPGSIGPYVGGAGGVPSSAPGGQPTAGTRLAGFGGGPLSGAPAPGPAVAPTTAASSAGGPSGMGGFGGLLPPVPAGAGVGAAGEPGQPALAESGFPGSSISAASEAGMSADQGLGASAAADSLAAQDAGAATAAGAGNAEGLPGAVPGVGGAGAGEGGAVQSRQYWSTEDESTWGSDTLSGVGGPADGSGWLGVGGRGVSDRPARQAWLGEDDDLWQDPEPAVPPVLGVKSRRAGG